MTVRRGRKRRMRVKKVRRVRKGRKGRMRGKKVRRVRKGRIRVRYR
jgi:hypothetical protein